jgi:hypothetical protein
VRLVWTVGEAEVPDVRVPIEAVKVLEKTFGC